MLRRPEGCSVASERMVGEIDSKTAIRLDIITSDTCLVSFSHRVLMKMTQGMMT